MAPAARRRRPNAGENGPGWPRGWAPRSVVAISWLLGSLSCTHDVGLLSAPDASAAGDHTTDIDQRTGDGSDRSGSGGNAGAGGGGGGTAINSVCTGGPVRFPGANGICSATLAARSHRFALCSCSDWTVSAPFSTDLLFPTNGGPPGPGPAAVGVNGKITATAGLLLQGSLYASGSGGITDSAGLNVGRTLHSGGPVLLSQPATGSVMGDAFISGDVMGPLHVGGALHLPPTATMGLATTAAATVREAVNVAAPCDCTVPFDIGGVISMLSTTNDNASIGLNPSRLVTPGSAVSLDIPCGAFFLDSINSLSPINLAVHGRAVLAIGGDVLLSGGMTIIMDQGAELDLLIFGGITSYGMAPVGAWQASSLRIWMAGSSPLTFYGHPTIGGMFEAPLATVSAPSGMEVDGSIVAASLNLGDDVVVHFDQNVFTSGVACGDPQLDPVP